MDDEDRIILIEEEKKRNAFIPKYLKFSCLKKILPKKNFLTPSDQTVHWPEMECDSDSQSEEDDGEDWGAEDHEDDQDEIPVKPLTMKERYDSW